LNTLENLENNDKPGISQREAQGETSPPCQEVEALIPAYAFGAADLDEESLVKGLLAKCPGATAQLAEYTPLAQTMLYSAPPVRAPEYLAQRLRVACSSSGIQAGQSHQSGWRQRFWGWWTHWRQSPQFLAMAGALALLLALNLYLFQQNWQLRRAQTLLAGQIAAQNTALFVLASDGIQQVTLPSVQEHSPAHAIVKWNPAFDVAILYVEEFPPLPEGKVYQLWLAQGDEHVSGGLFTVNHKGTGALLFHPPQPLDALDALIITPESAGGSPVPTAPPVAGGPI
jgi:anti-sigma-K factor RskA